MKSTKYLFSSVSLLMLLPTLALAGEAAQRQAAREAAGFVKTFNEVILFPTIALLLAIAFLVFLFGCAQYFMNAADPAGRQQGVKHITFGIIGLVVMVSAFAILKIATGTFSLDAELKCADDPDSVNCTGVFSVPE